MKKDSSFTLSDISDFSGSSDFSRMWSMDDVCERKALQDEMQSVVDKTLKAEFDVFDKDPSAASNNPVMKYYDKALHRLLADIPQTSVQPGTVMIWYLYNMGFVIKTPTVCFGVDIHHRHAIKLESLLDFIVVTHNHIDHYNEHLLRTMSENDKMVVSNFFPNAGYTKAASYTHEIKGVTIHCGEANHNNILRKFTMPMEIICPTGNKQFVFFTSGDVFHHEFLNACSETVDLYAVHPRCGMEALEAAKKLNAKMTLIVHLHEMGHEYNLWRWQFSVGRDELEKFAENGFKAYAPVWGEKILWDGEKLIFCR